MGTTLREFKKGTQGLIDDSDVTDKKNIIEIDQQQKSIEKVETKEQEHNK